MHIVSRTRPSCGPPDGAVRKTVDRRSIVLVASTSFRFVRGFSAPAGPETVQCQSRPARTDSARHLRGVFCGVHAVFFVRTLFHLKCVTGALSSERGTPIA